MDDGLETLGITEEEEEQDINVGQPIHQEVGQEAIDQSEVNDQDDDNTQIQTGVDHQETAQGTVDGNDLAESSSEPGDAKYSSAGSSFSDAEYTNEQGADNDEELNQAQEEDIDQDHETIFADDTADLDGTDVTVLIATPIDVQEELEEVVDDDNGDNGVVCILNQGELQLVELTAEIQAFIDAGFVTELPLEACLTSGIGLG